MWGQFLNWYLKRYMNNMPSWMNTMNGKDVGQWMQSFMPFMGNSYPQEFGKGDSDLNLPRRQNVMPWGTPPWNQLPTELPPWIQNMISTNSGLPRAGNHIGYTQNTPSMPSFSDLMNQWPFNQMNSQQSGGQRKGNPRR